MFLLFSTISIATSALAGGDPRQVMVVASGDDVDSLTIAEHYATSRQLPAGHVCVLTGLTPSETTVLWDDYASVVPDAIDACLAALPDPDAIDILVTTRGLPYRVDLGAGYVVGFEALLQIHRSTVRSDGSLLAGSPQTDLGGYYAARVENPAFVGAGPFTAGGEFTETSDFAQWYSAACHLLDSGNLPEAFDRQGDWDVGAWKMADNLFIVTRLDGFDAADAMDLVDRGVAADGTAPTAPLLCMKGADAARGARDPECELVVRRLSEAGLSADWIDTFDGGLSGETVAGYFTGAAELTGAIAGNTYVPGALTDNLTSYGAVPGNFFCDASGTTCPASESQTSVARFVRAGATGVHGTVAEPLNNVFPNSTVYLLYTFGYSLGESYFFSQRYLYWQNLVLGDPLTTPYAVRPTVALDTEAVSVEGTVTLTATHPDGVAATWLYRNDLLVAEAAGPDLVVDADEIGEVGETVSLFLLAEAESVAVSRLGWETETWNPQAGVRGWGTATLTLTEPVVVEPEDSGTPTEEQEPDPDPDPEARADTALPEESGEAPAKSTGCAAVATGAGGVGWVMLAGLMGRRRRG